MSLVQQPNMILGLEKLVESTESDQMDKFNTV